MTPREMLYPYPPKFGGETILLLLGIIAVAVFGMLFLTGGI